MTVEFVNLKQIGQSLMRAVIYLTTWHYNQGRKIILIAKNKIQAEEINQMLWEYDPASFLPHALAGNIDEAQEPILIEIKLKNINHAEILITLVSLDPFLTELKSFKHLIEFIPIKEGAELISARKRYKQWQKINGIQLIHTICLPN